MFIQTEATPNPATQKFLPGRVVMENGTAEFRSPDEAQASPLAARLFEIPGVTGVYFGYDFISVSKDNAEWQHLKPAILGSIMEHFMSGKPVMGDASILSEDLDAGGEFFDEADVLRLPVLDGDAEAWRAEPASPFRSGSRGSRRRLTTTPCSGIRPGAAIASAAG